MITAAQLIEFARALGYLGSNEVPKPKDWRIMLWLYREAQLHAMTKPQEDTWTKSK